MEVALPTNLDGPELIRYVKDKRDAQEKLAGYFEDQALYLGTPGASKAGWLQLQKENRSKKAEPTDLPPKNQQGWNLMTDANGNKAYVSPDGQIEEVQ